MWLIELSRGVLKSNVKSEGYTVPYYCEIIDDHENKKSPYNTVVPV